jgi:2-hydroxy-3-keto-5-methylthiopentenyl-1-phosphate phosphatase
VSETKTPRGAKTAVLTDFDGTVVTKDLAYMALEAFARPGWKEFDDDLEAGRITLESSLRSQYGLVRAGSVSEILEAVRPHYQLREGFAQLAKACRLRCVPLVMVSAGLDFCIRDALSTLGVGVDRLVCPRSKLTSRGIKVEFPAFARPARNFKEEVVLEYRRQGTTTVYAGDGYSDFYPASKADTAFAVRGSVLERQCKANGIHCVTFEDFGDVLPTIA